MSSNGYSIFLSGHLLRDGENKVRSVDSTIVKPLLHFSGCEVSSLVRSNTAWTPTMVDKAFRKSMDGGFGRSITCRKKQIHNRISIHSNKDKMSFP